MGSRGRDDGMELDNSEATSIQSLIDESYEDSRNSSMKKVTKPSAIIQMTNRVTIMQRLAWNVLLADAYPHLNSREKHRKSVKELIAQIGYKNTNKKMFREMMQGIVTTGVRYNLFSKDKRVWNDDSWGATTLLAYVEVKNGMIEYSYSPPLRERLATPEMYARISLIVQKTFKCKHALALYELCIDYKGTGSTGFLELSRLRSFFGLEEQEYSTFSDFNKYVIKLATKEINQKSDLLIEPEYKRESRKVVAIRFGIRENLTSSLREMSIPKKEGEQPMLPFDEGAPPVEAKLIERMKTQFGIHSNVAIKLAERYPAKHILENLDYVVKKVAWYNRRNQPCDPAALAVAAIRRDYYHAVRDQIAGQVVTEQKRKAVGLKVRDQETRQMLTDIYLRFQNFCIKEALDRLSPAEAGKHLNTFERSLGDPVQVELFRAARQMDRPLADPSLIAGLAAYLEEVCPHAYFPGSFENWLEKEHAVVVKGDTLVFPAVDPKVEKEFKEYHLLLESEVELIWEQLPQAEREEILESCERSIGNWYWRMMFREYRDENPSDSRPFLRFMATRYAAAMRVPGDFEAFAAKAGLKLRRIGEGYEAHDYAVEA